MGVGLVVYGSGLRVEGTITCTLGPCIRHPTMHIFRTLTARDVPLAFAEIVQSGVGDSERILAGVFQKAAKAAPCMIFLDEMQASPRPALRAGELRC